MSRRRLLAAARFAFASMLLPSVPAPAATVLPDGFEEERVTGPALERPTSMAFAPDGRLFVCEQAGALRVVRDGAVLPAPFLRLDVDATGERGLLGVAVDPAFAENGHLYVYYTARTPTAHDRVSRFTARGDVAAAESEVVLLDIVGPVHGAMHNAGALRFASDGTLLVAVGDHGQPASAPSLESLFGKLLRMNRDGSIPADNPHYRSVAGVHRLIWASGLRNPAALDVDPSSGRLFVNDVGARAWEEINEGIAGADYGWPSSEGPAAEPMRSPLHAYAWHENETPACSIVGAAFYPPNARQFPSEYAGRYFFADLCGNWIDTLSADGRSRARFASQTAPSPVDLEVAPDGSLYYLTYKGGLHRIRFEGGQASGAR